MTQDHVSVVDSLGSITETLDQVCERLNRPPRGLGGTVQASHYFKRLLEVSRQMNSTLELNGVLDLAVETLVELFAAEKGFLILADEEGELTLRVAVDAEEGDLAEATAEISRSIVDEAIQRQTPILVENALEDERFKDKASVRELGLRSAMCVPLAGREGALGAIYIDHRLVEGKFAESDLEVLSLFGNQVATAIENARLFEQETRRAGGMELLYRVGHTALARLNHESMLAAVLEQLPLTGFGDGGAVLLAETDESNPSLRVESHAGLSDEFAVILGTAGLMQFVENGPTAVAAADLPDASLAAACEAEGLRHVAFASLELEERALGLLVVVRKDQRPFSLDELDLLSILAAETRMAIYNLRLYHQLQETNEELRQTQEMVLQEERLRALGTMASGIAHDINNALMPILGFSELLLRRRDLDADACRQLKLIATSSKDIAGTVERLREFYRKQGADEPLRPVAVAPLIAETVALTEPRWRDMSHERGVTVTMHTEVEDGLPCIAGVEAELREALTNLVLNAVDAMPEGGDLSIRAKAEGSCVVLSVTDTGIGMTDEIRQRCLEPFFSTKPDRGTGLGLGVVYGIVKRLGGEVTIESAPGRGSTFALRLPATVGRPADEGAAPVTVRPLHVLCIDDEESVLSFLSDALNGMGHTVETANGGAEGLEAFGRGNFDVVITDLGMPEVDGRAVAKSLKDRSPGTPIILLTGWGTKLHVEGDLPEGVDRVVNKPVSPAALGEALAALVGTG